MALRASSAARTRPTACFWACICACLTAAPLAAQEDATGKLTIELNSIQPEEGSCRMSFVVLNGHDTDLKTAVFEAVLFNAEGAVDRLTLFDFGALPAGRPRVRQFVVPQLGCDHLGQILINGAQSCEADSSDDLCSKGLTLTSRIPVEVTG